MSITPASPQPRTPIATWKIDAMGLRVYDRKVTLVYGGYDANGVKVTERRFDLDDNTAVTIADYLSACPATLNVKQQTEAFGSTLAAELGGTVG